MKLRITGKILEGSIIALILLAFAIPLAVWAESMSVASDSKSTVLAVSPDIRTKIKTSAVLQVKTITDRMVIMVF